MTGSNKRNGTMDSKAEVYRSVRMNGRDLWRRTKLRGKRQEVTSERANEMDEGKKRK